MDIQQIVSQVSSGGELQNVAAKVGVSPDQAQTMLHGFLSHVDNGGAPEQAVGAVAQRTGVDPSIVGQFLPLVLPLLQNHAANAPAGSQSELGGLVGAVSGMLGGANGGGAGGLFGAAESLFGRSE